MERDVWHKRFTKKLQQEHEAQSAFDCLLRHHCDRAVVEDLLFAIAVQDKLTSQQIFRLENDFNVTSYILGEALQMLAKDLAMQRSQYVPFGPLLVRIVKLEKELMSVGGNLAELSRGVAYWREMFECGIPLLSAYVSKITGKKLYEQLGALVRCAQLLPASEAARLDNVRVAIDRFRKHNPSLWRIIQRVVATTLASGLPIEKQDLHIRLWECASELGECGRLEMRRVNQVVRDSSWAKRYLSRHDISIGHSHAAKLLGVGGRRPSKQGNGP